MKNAVHQKIMAVVGQYKKAKHNSTLFQDGKVTPEEFVVAGDSLVAACPSWNWCPSADPSKAKDYLPPDKQYLINRGVVCQNRAQDLKKMMEKEDVAGEFTDWVLSGESAQKEVIDLDSNEEVVDLDDIDIDEIQPEFESAPNLNYRTYDITIVYDNYYNTAHVYLYGTNSKGIPLTLEEMYEDISADHAEKTVTYENHPYLAQKALSIHACQHHHIMHQLISRLDNPEGFCAPEYMFLFLKFIHTVIPTIDISTPSLDIDGINA